MAAGLLALAVIQAGMAMHQQNQQIKAANKAQRDSIDASIENQNRLAKEGLKKKKEQGTMLGGSAVAQQNAEQGTILTSADNSKRSLLG